MSDETVKVDNNGRIFEITQYWSNTWDDLQITDREGENIYNRMLVRLSPNALRAIADSFYSWADLLENRAFDKEHEKDAKPVIKHEPFQDWHTRGLDSERRKK